MKTKSYCSHPGSYVLGGWVGESPPIFFTVTRIDWKITNIHNNKTRVSVSLNPSNTFSNPMIKFVPTSASSYALGLSLGRITF